MKAKSTPTDAGGFTLVECLVVLAVIGLLAAILMPALARAREASRRAACANNLRQVGMALNMYAHENGGLYPALQGFSTECEITSVNLMFDGPAMIPDYLSDERPLVCPSDADGTEKYAAGRWFDERGRFDPCRLDPLSYIYVPWVLRMDFLETPRGFLDEGFVSALARASLMLNRSEAAPFDWRFEDENGDVPTVYFLRHGVERFVDPRVEQHPERGIPTSRIPVMFDVVNVAVGDFNHVPGGANVLFMDGHVAFESYPNDSVYPATRAWALAMNNTPRDWLRKAEKAAPPDDKGAAAPRVAGAEVAGTPWWADAPNPYETQGAAEPRYGLPPPPPPDPEEEEDPPPADPEPPESAPPDQPPDTSRGLDQEIRSVSFIKGNAGQGGSRGTRGGGSGRPGQGATRFGQPQTVSTAPANLDGLRSRSQAPSHSSGDRRSAATDHAPRAHWAAAEDDRDGDEPMSLILDPLAGLKDE